MLNNRIIIRITLWWGIIADLIETIRMVIPSLFITTTGLNATYNNSFRFALLYGAPVMLGWTLLLFWAARKPIERKGIFVCLVPVIIGYFVVEMVGIRMGVLTLKNTLPTFILQTFLLIMSIISFYVARESEKKDAPSE